MALRGSCVACRDCYFGRVQGYRRSSTETIGRREIQVVDLSPDQLRVHDAVLDWLKNPGAPHWRAYAMLTDPSATELRIMTVGGNGGTGKTTVLGRLARSFPTPTAYVAPTGRAASKLTNSLIAGGMRITKLQRPPEGKKLSRKWRHLFDDSLPENGGPPLCTTTHSLLLRAIIDSKTEELLGWQARTKLDRQYKLIVVDEASMVGDKMLLTLQSHGVLVLAVGDHHRRFRARLQHDRCLRRARRAAVCRIQLVDRHAHGPDVDDGNHAAGR